MFPDLGKYAFAVLASYGSTFVLLAGIVGLTFWRSARVKRRLAMMEARRGGSNV